MQRNLLKSKIHRATVTASELHYEGSCAIDLDLLEAADIREFERVEIWNVSNGARLNTYAIVAERGSGTISLNGSAARHAQVGDLVIIATFADYTDEESRAHKPRLVFVDGANRQKELRDFVPVQK